MRELQTHPVQEVSSRTVCDSLFPLSSDGSDILLTTSRAKLDKYPDGYPGDAEPPAEPPARTWKKPRLRVRYTCHKCSTMYRSGEKTCANCGQEKCSETIRDPYVMASNPFTMDVRYLLTSPQTQETKTRTRPGGSETGGRAIESYAQRWLGMQFGGVTSFKRLAWFHEFSFHYSNTTSVHSFPTTIPFGTVELAHQGTAPCQSSFGNTTQVSPYRMFAYHKTVGLSSRTDKSCVTILHLRSVKPKQNDWHTQQAQLPTIVWSKK